MSLAVVEKLGVCNILQEASDIFLNVGSIDKKGVFSYCTKFVFSYSNLLPFLLNMIYFSIPPIIIFPDSSNV